MLRIASLCREWKEKCKSSNPFLLAEEMGVQVVSCPEFQNLEGMYKVVLGKPFVFIKGSLSRRRAGEVLAHELGHHVLHREMGEDSIVQDSFLVDMTLKPEYEANLFAAELLVPDESVSALVTEGKTGEQIARLLKVDPRLVRLKLEIMKQQGLLP